MRTDATSANAAPPPWAGCAETHTAVVYFAGDRVAKLKKPVDLGFVDFTTREARHTACRNEVDLNRRFAPDVYLGVGDIRDEDGEVLDHLVLMRRMPDHRRLSSLVSAGAPVDDALRDVARMLSVWHAKAPRGPGIDRQGTRDMLRRRWTDSFAQVRALPEPVTDPVSADIDEIERLTPAYLRGRGELFDQRVRQYRVVEGHGDLLADDVFCLDDGPRVLDCLEFDESLRSLDGLDDAAFLAMDLERLGAPELAERFLRWYVEFSGDPAPTSLWHHYVAYRAFVRAKVAWMRSAQGAAGAARLAARYCALTLRHLRAGAVRLILVGGLPGTGKSTLAGGLADTLGMCVLSTDRLRKDLAGLDRGEAAPASLYGPDRIAANYDAMLARARQMLSMGESVVLDASWHAAGPRDKAARVAEAAAAELVSLQCVADEATAFERLAARRGDWSDADAAVARKMAAETEPWNGRHDLDAGASADACLAQAVGILRPTGTTVSFGRRPHMEAD
ncbi:MAG TPA: AAA family ATPase [Yinghuangia sp.]|nr:AAA family ATPase [Yinghuangia sp.]